MDGLLKTPEEIARSCLDLSSGTKWWPTGAGRRERVAAAKVGDAELVFVRGEPDPGTGSIGDVPAYATFVSEFVRVVSGAIREAIDQQCRFGLGEPPFGGDKLDEVVKFLDGEMVSWDQGQAWDALMLYIAHLKAQVVFLSRETGAAEAYALGHADGCKKGKTE